MKRNDTQQRLAAEIWSRITGTKERDVLESNSFLECSCSRDVGKG
jgi:hypothetical protein